MQAFAFMLKTYQEDLGYVGRLINSFNMFNRDNILLFMVIPKAEKELFFQFESDLVKIIFEEEFKVDLFNENFKNFSQGYLNQEIYKLAFWELELCENYFCIDSEAYFIRDFYLSDFMYDLDVPYSCLMEDKELQVEPEYYKMYWETRERRIEQIQSYLDYHSKKNLTCHGFQTLSAKVLNDFKINYLNIKGYSYKNVIELVPLEFSWYCIWLQKRKIIPIHVCEPIFKTFHTKKQHLLSYYQGINITDLARGYVGIVINSNFSKKAGIIFYEEVNKYNEVEAIPLKHICIMLKLIIRQPLNHLIKYVVKTMTYIYIHTKKRKIT